MPSLRQLQASFSKFRQLVTESRVSTRQPFETAADLAWRDGHGRITQARGRCLDISESGARIAYADRIALPAVMQIRTEHDGVLRTGRVRHCTPHGSQYEIGIEFCDPGALQAPAKT
jgi:hypothetical protein